MGSGAESTDLESSLLKACNIASENVAAVRREFERNRSKSQKLQGLLAALKVLSDHWTVDLAGAVERPTDGPHWKQQLYQGLPQILKKGLFDDSVGDQFKGRFPVKERTGPHRKIAGVLEDLSDLKQEIFVALVKHICSTYEDLTNILSEFQTPSLRGPLHHFRNEIARVCNFFPRATGRDDPLWSRLRRIRPLELQQRVLAIAHGLDTERLLNASFQRQPPGKRRGA
jgi:hypothetical protein